MYTESVDLFEGVATEPEEQRQRCVAAATTLAYKPCSKPGCKRAAAVRCKRAAAVRCKRAAAANCKRAVGGCKRASN